MRRREALTLIVGSAVAPLAAGAQVRARPKPLRVAITTRQPRSASFIVAFQNRLRELGHVDGENLALDVRQVIGNDDQHFAAMRDLVDLQPDILIASGPEAAVKAAIAAAPALPIVMIAVDYDPIALGYVRSLAKPGGNITGVVFQQPELAVKRMQIMKEALPDLTLATVVWDAASADQRKEVQHAAAELRLQLTDAEFRDQPYEYEAAFAPTGDGRALLVCVSPIFFRERQVIAAAALRHRAMTMFGLREFVEAGGLLSYGASISALYRRAADYVARIAQGTKPADLPIEQPTKFELVINLKTAKEIGLTIPPTLLARADEVIE
jgi:ABC-type uncharacterized transport system substrate-binding protein